MFFQEAGSEIKCCVCQTETTGAHECPICLKPVHAICRGNLNDDNPDLEGYGSKVTCKNCTNSEPPVKKTTSWCIKFPPNLDLKHKTPQSKSSTRSTESRCICLNCFCRNEDPKVYVLSRRNPSTKERHVRRRHPESTLKDIEIYNFECNRSDLEKARQMYYGSNQNNAEKSSKQPSQRLILFSSSKEKKCNLTQSTLKSTRNNQPQNNVNPRK